MKGLVAMVGILRKLKTHYHDPIEYYASVGEQSIFLNPFIGQPITLSYTGHIYCIQCGRKTKTSFQQGFCFLCFRRLQECGLCIIHPERCRVEEGCPKDDWAHAQCNGSHIVYLANGSGLKVGITRETQVPTRWIDQGAAQAIPFFHTANRYQAGIIEVLLKKYVSDRTDWRVMLRGEAPLLDLVSLCEELLLKTQEELDPIIARWDRGNIESVESPMVTFLSYPVLEYPRKISSLSLDQEPLIQGRLLGIKGQYLILDTGVINIRKFSGYEVELLL
jgi:hypothetical protein